MKAKTQIWGFLLFPLSMILLISTAWLGLLYSFFSVPIKISFKGLLQRWHQYFLKMAISIDQLGNVVLQDLFNDLLITTCSSYWWCNFYAGENAYNPELDDVKNDAGCKQ